MRADAPNSSVPGRVAQPLRALLLCAIELLRCNGSRSGTRWRVFDGAQQCRELGRSVCFRRHDLAGALQRLVGV